MVIGVLDLFFAVCCIFYLPKTPLNVNEIADAINWIMDNQDKAKKMGENGRKAVEEKYNWEQEGCKLVGIYERLVREMGVRVK
jgi:glycosyltransferase involved in cell wall biosynthesis